MRQNSQRPKTKIEPKLESTIVIRQPLVRDFSTGGGHTSADTIAEGDQTTKKWQGYPPENLHVVGKPMPAMPEVSIPRFTGTALYASRVVLPNMLFAKMLASPHPRARIKSIDTSKAEKMPGVAYVLTYKNGPTNLPATKAIDSRTNATIGALTQELNFFGDVVAFVAAETEDLAEDAVEMIQVEYEVLPFASTLAQVMSGNAPDLRQGKGNLFQPPKDDPRYAEGVTSKQERGDVEKGFAQADIVKEFTFYFAGATSIPIQPFGSVAKWDGDKLTFWGMCQGIYPHRAQIARGLGIDPKQIRFINKYNGCSFGAVEEASKMNVFVAYLAKVTGRPVKLMLPKDQEVAHLRVKPENISKLKVGIQKDGRIIALTQDVYETVGINSHIGGSAIGGGGGGGTVYTLATPNLRVTDSCYATNSMRTGAVRQPGEQEYKWAWEIMIDEMAEAVKMDPLQFRLMQITRPGAKAPGQNASRYDSFGSVEVLQEGAKAFGWDKRNPVANSLPGRFKRGMGMGLTEGGAGLPGIHEGEAGFAKLLEQQGRIRAEGIYGSTITEVFSSELEVNADGIVVYKSSIPDSGQNNATGLCAIVSEMLGFTTRNNIRVIWGDTDLTPVSDRFRGANSLTLHGGSVFSAADKLRKDLIQRAADTLKVDAATLQVKDGVISSTEDPRKRTTFAALARAAQGRVIRQTGRALPAGGGRSYTAVGACFVEVEVDTWTGDWRFLRSVYSHDWGMVVNPLTAQSEMHGSLVQTFSTVTDSLPWDREFPGTRHYAVGYLSYRLPTIMEVPDDQTNIFIDSLEPRWFYGTKGGSESSIGAVPGAIANAIYNACGVRIYNHPLTKDKIMAGLKARGLRS